MFRTGQRLPPAPPMREPKPEVVAGRNRKAVLHPVEDLGRVLAVSHRGQRIVEDATGHSGQRAHRGLSPHQPRPSPVGLNADRRPSRRGGRPQDADFGCAGVLTLLGCSPAFGEAVFFRSPAGVVARWRPT